MSTVREAMQFVSERLAGKTRKGSGAPYECHLYSVLGTVISYGGGPNLQMAAVLHDVVEDCGVTLDELAARFGAAVAKLVERVTEDKTLPSWAERKKKLLRNARERCQAVALLLIADKMDNLRSFWREMHHQPDYWEKFNAGFTDQLRFHQALGRALHANPRVADGLEYPELKTRQAFSEFCNAFDLFRAAHLWGPDNSIIYTGEPFESILGGELLARLLAYETQGENP